MGRFNHEAVAADPETGIVYETEDRHDGLIYRYIPHQPGKLSAGGKLQALAIKGQKSFDTRNWEETTIQPGHPLDAEWIDLENVADRKRAVSGKRGSVRVDPGGRRSLKTKKCVRATISTREESKNNPSRDQK